MSILVAIDGERAPSRTIEEAYTLANDLNEELLVMHVMSEDVVDQLRNATAETRTVPYLPSNLSHTPQSGGKTPYTVETGKEDAASVGREILETTLDDWENVRFLGRVGDPITQILGEADRSDIRYLVIGGRKRNPVGKAVFGSTSQSILLNADLPVLTVMHDD